MHGYGTLHNEMYFLYLQPITTKKQNPHITAHKMEKNI